MKFEITNEVLNNLLVFLDRVSITGRKELSAMNQILYVLNNPIKEEKDNAEDNYNVKK